jgi:hypothetical protein
MTMYGSTDLKSLKKGAPVLGSDYEIGTLERVESSGEKDVLLVQHGHAADLLAIPADMIAEANSDVIKLRCTREDAEVMIFQQDAEPGTVKPSPLASDLLGAPIEEALMDGPSTG